ncbi:MAG: LytR family transcriptional regulator, partial [Cellulomonas sp.]|nr:LytR family transcriptional regulator [Cellulomonas sp.]
MPRGIGAGALVDRIGSAAVASRHPDYDRSVSQPESASPDVSSEKRRARRSKRQHGWRDRRVLLVALSIIGVLIAGAAIGVQVFQSRLNANIERIGDPFAALPTRPAAPAAPTGAATAGAPAAAGPAVNILLLGSDSRISAGDPNQWTYGGQRTDAVMLVHIPADRSGAYLFSIPRDSWVDIPGHGQAKINAAYSWGGPALLIQTVEQLTNVRIDHMAVTDFESFQALTDELGGVEITAPKDVYDGGTLVTQAGTHLLNGTQALAYV